MGGENAEQSVHRGTTPGLPTSEHRTAHSRPTAISSVDASLTFCIMTMGGNVILCGGAPAIQTDVRGFPQSLQYLFLANPFQQPRR